MIEKRRLKLIPVFLTAFFSVPLLTQCTFEKRLYRSGYYTDIIPHRTSPLSVAQIKSEIRQQDACTLKNETAVTENDGITASAASSPGEIIQESTTVSKPKINFVTVKDTLKAKARKNIFANMDTDVSDSYTYQLGMALFVLLGFLTLVAPGLIWISFVGVFAWPILLLAALYHAAEGFSKKPDIENKKKLLQLWTLLLVLNLVMAVLLYMSVATFLENK